MFVSFKPKWHRAMSPFYGLLVLNFRKIRKSNLHGEVKREKQWLG